MPTLRGCGLLAIHFNEQTPETTLRSRIRLLRVLAKPEKSAEPSRIGNTLILQGFKHEPRNPLLPLASPSECRLGTDWPT